MKKFFEEPSIECLVLYTESIANGNIDLSNVTGNMGTGDKDESWA